MSRVTTMAAMLWPLMDAPSIETPHCAVCGRSGHLERHHLVRRGAGQLVRHGAIVPKPTITLCGHGNACGCHGAAHAGLLHFRWVSDPADGGHLEWLLLDRPAPYAEALDSEGWRALRGGGRTR